MEDQQPDSGDLTADGNATAERPRRRFFGRRSKPSADEPTVETVVDKTVAEPVDETVAADETVAEPAVETAKTPKGKAARASRTRTAEAVPPPTEEIATEETAAEETVAKETATAEPVTENAGETETEVEASESSDPGSDLETEPPVMVPHRPAGRGALVAAAVASVVFVGASAFAASMVQPYVSERALVQTKLDIARAATDAISALWTYTPDDMATLADRASGYLGGEFAEEYRRYIDAIVEPNKQAQVTNTTEVMGAAVESISPPSVPTEATALVYTNSVATSPVTKNIPALRYLSYRLTMHREGGDWRIIRMSTITSFDLTPQL
ncbi:Mce-associated membrane protein [Mycolicibacterium iranicum]|uniref:Mce-associated membrane protein n=1 Tax=Mycolicibacterium iranicum TaxID=912594 RepID=A0A839Q1T8_MYCIR|nr:mammalian cell entry protein [Mycolicibacterium iranicum]MBB2988884.1 Mce-associated membrane protein [Mycolicibacterium iranicum]